MSFSYRGLFYGYIVLIREGPTRATIVARGVELLEGGTEDPEVLKSDNLIKLVSLLKLIVSVYSIISSYTLRITIGYFLRIS